MLLDDAGDPGLRTLEMMAVETIERGWHGRALAHHCRAMSLYPMPYVQRLARLLRAARIAVVTDPHTGPLHARVKELLADGVIVCLGQDDISDAYYAFGRNNMLEVAFLASHLLWMMTRQEVEKLYDMITVDAATAINSAGLWFDRGSRWPTSSCSTNPTSSRRCVFTNRRRMSSKMGPWSIKRACAPLQRSPRPPQVQRGRAK